MKRPIMLSLLISLLLLSGVFTGTQTGMVGAFESKHFATRCGWFSNPTPANASLYDREREWIIAVQGGHQAKGEWPHFASKQWVETNVHYGYGCACLRVRVNR